MSEDGGIVALTMPKWGMSMVTGKITAWIVEEGAALKEGDETVEVETDKIANVVESNGSGVLRRRVAGVDSELPIGALLGVIAGEGVAEAQIDAFVEDFQANYTPPEEGAAGGPVPVIAEIDGLRINHLIMGEGEETVVFVHGFGGDLNNWLFNQPVLAASRRTIALDLPGHGASSKDIADASVAGLAAAVGGLLDGLDVGRAHFVGHSLGGAVAATVALAAPGRAASLTLVASAGLGAEIDSTYVFDFIAANRRKAVKPLLARLFADQTLVSRDMINEVLKFKRIEGVEAALRAVAEAAFSDGRQNDQLADRLAALEAPVQVIWGAEDRIIPVGHAEALAGTARIEVIEKAGHMVHMEAAREVNQLLESFMAGE